MIICLHNTKLAMCAENNPENNYLIISVCDLNISVYSILWDLFTGLEQKLINGIRVRNETVEK